MNKQSAFINEESHEKIVKENEEEKHKELKKELKRKRNCERQRAFYQRQKHLKKNEEKIKKKPKTNAERQREYRQRKAEKSYVDMKRRKLCSNIENVTLQENQFHSQQLHIYEQCDECITPEVILHRNTGIPGDVKPAKTSKCSEELDKFKRRLIRSVARLLLQENKPEDEVWIELRKETGCDCMLLWSRMRALTLKKLDRLFAADDRIESIPKAARMSLTDWLLFDLVLVHQKIDLIGQDEALKSDSKQDPEPLVNLFELVKMFQIEGRSGENLAEAWSTATLYYNNQGHQCSPMLLQRRWYQLKEATRAKFYDFWYSYRGTAKRLSQAEPHMPSKLQAAIAAQYKHLVTSPFIQWEELIKSRLVTMPEEFERKMMEKSARVLQNDPVITRDEADDGPDLEVIEPNIETIDLRLESDNENEKSAEEEESHPSTVKIKEEPLDMDIDIDETQLAFPKKSIYEEVLESTAIENEHLDNMDTDIASLPMDDEVVNEENEIEESIESTLRTQEDTKLPQITSVFGNVSDTSVICNIDNTNKVGSADNNSVIRDVDDNSDIKNESDDIRHNISECNENLSKMTSMNAEITNTTVTDIVATIRDDVLDENSSNSALINEHNEVDMSEEIHEIKEEQEIEEISDSEDLTDIVKLKDLDDIYENKKIPNIEIIHKTEKNQEVDKIHEIEDTEFKVSENNSAQDMKVDVEPKLRKYSFQVSNMNEVKSEDKKLEVNSSFTCYSYFELSDNIQFADDGILFNEEEYEYRDRDDTKPNIQDEDEENANDTPQIDEKLLMCPIIYTMKLDHMGLFHKAPFDHVKGSQILDIITWKSKPTKKVPENTISNDNVEYDNNNEVENEDEDDECEGNIITDNQRVKPTSYMLQKPRSRTYNPIQLCKNPDFNTRLKRLNVGFFSSPRNRGLIKSCKPVTIDLSKAFETKLVAGTLYLKPNDQNIKPEIKDVTESSQSVSVVPSAMPAQSLIDNSKIVDVLPLYRSPSAFTTPPNDASSTSERNKVINLPDISEIRRINQRLLTAEVTPIQVQNNMMQVPVSLVTSFNSNIPKTNAIAPVPEPSIVVANDKDILTTANDIRSVPKTIEVNQYSSLNKNIENNPALRPNSNKWPYRPPQEDQTYRYVSRPQKTVNDNRKKLQKPTVLWKPRQIRPEIPWLSKNSEQAQIIKNKDETLLTLDTLNKMLYLLTYDKEDTTIVLVTKSKKKKKQVPKEQSAGNRKPVSADSSDVQILSETKNTIEKGKKTDKQQEKKTKKYAKPKINIKSAVNGPLQKEGNKQKTIDSDSLKSTEQIKYCCWSRQRMLQMLFSRKKIPDHDCKVSLCTCCCRKLLEQYVINDYKIKKAESLSTPIEVDDDEQENVAENAKTSEAHIEIIVEPQPVETTNPETVIEPFKVRVEVPIIDDKASKDGSNNVTESETIDIDALNSQDGVPALGSEISVTTSSVSPLILSLVNESLRNAPEVSSAPTGVSTCNVDEGQRKRNTVIRTRMMPMLGNSDPDTVFTTRITKPKTCDLIMPPSLKTLLETKKAKNRNKNNQLSSYTQKQPNNREKVIFLSTKQLSERPTDNPIFLGKSKILLTTVKFPPNLKQFEEAKQNLRPMLKLPRGVQLVCLPNGTVTYTIDPNVEVNASELSSLPAIVAAVQAQINTSQPQPEINVPKTGFKENEVVDLIDDDDTPKNNDNNTEPSTAVGVLTTEVDLTKNHPQTITEENCAESNNENSKLHSIETGTEDIQNAVKDQTENVPGSTHNVIPSTTTEQYQLEDSCPINIDEQVKLTSEPTPSTSTEQNHSEAIQPEKNEIASTTTELHQSEAENIEKQEKIMTEPRPSISSEQDHTEVNQTEKVEEQEKSGSEPNKMKNNILSDLMEMWGIFDEDVTSTPGETLPEKPVEPVVLKQGNTETMVPLSLEPVAEQPVVAAALASVDQPIISSEDPPPLAPVNSSASSLPQCSRFVPKPALDSNRGPPIIKSPIGDLSPITSLYELKYACLNNGAFFKLDFETGFLVPINVCMKQHPKPSLAPLKPIVTKSVIDLTDDDDLVSTSGYSHNNRSLLISNNLFSVSAGPSKASSVTNSSQVKPIKMFRSKPVILQRLGQNNIVNEEIYNEGANKNLSGEHRHKRKQSLKEVDVDIKIRFKKQYSKKTKLKTDLVDKDNPADRVIHKPVPIEPRKITTNYESDDSSDEEPLSKIAKRQKESLVVPKVPNTDETAVQNEDAAAVQNEVEVAVQNEVVDLPASDSVDIDMSDQEPIDQETHYELVMDQDDDEEIEEENCILGV